MINRRMAGLMLVGTTVAGCTAGANTTPPMANVPTGPKTPSGLQRTALQGGAFLLQTAQLGTNQARSPALRRFCEFEASEQQGIVRAMGMAGYDVMPPPSLPAAKAAMLQELSSARGAAFDRMLIAAQQQGHQEALETYASIRQAGGPPAEGIIALLAEDRIREHLAELQMIRA
ncbi:DUF4142 domain-containing protein [Teichococcus vastitatis]|uniref:DUF4142 domain-containing protein n=1 Tax=Teichococcus vastitatis TaxID=2307076 RepID=UPI001300AAE7|nr:DUF4142 domain-containing protein [Pseudoroseomonas vastitatis]